ncbi:hypothetical protein [Actinoplanes missouriensis]|uniref:hypothetical protein n=1 Tax=Actinoplanes missouriensis TaxID=1866 RepID=UPI0018D407DB|nr:hypothetical protein [Actinoplanes missouriensis]
MSCHTILETARCEALFASSLPTGSHPDRTTVTRAISDAVRRHGGTRGCAGAMAGAYGENQESAALRMRWARGVIREVCPTWPRIPPEAPVSAATTTTPGGSPCVTSSLP